ncbi:TPA: hypothetical protein ACH3X1_010376 [Trebouxia sp. C0004]
MLAEMASLSLYDSALSCHFCAEQGEFAAVGFSDFSAVTGAVSTFGFVFYVQPIMMPLLSEMPATERGVRICPGPRVLFGVHVTGIAFVVYALIGFFGAADFGSNTQGNVLENDLGGGAVYLALSLPPVEFPTRKTLDYWLPVALLRWPWLRHVMETGTMLCISLLLALLFRSSSAKDINQLDCTRIPEGDPALLVLAVGTFCSIASLSTLGND